MGLPLSTITVSMIAVMLSMFTLHPSHNASQLIVRYEGFHSVPYNDEAGHCTVGIGRLLHKGKCNGTEARLTREQGYRDLVEHIRMVDAQLNRLVKVNLSQNELDALVSFSYNVGCGAVRGSKLLRLLNKGDKQGAADEFLNWTKRGGKSSRGLRNRRIEERKMFLNEKSDH